VKLQYPRSNIIDDPRCRIGDPGTECKIKKPNRGLIEGEQMTNATWEPYEEHGRLSTRSNLPDSVFAFPNQRKEPLTDAQHVRNAVARFDQVIDVSEADRALAFANIQKAAQYYNVDLSETNWEQLGVHPQRNREEAAAKGAATRRRERE
jgi:hypothetical protein